MRTDYAFVNKQIIETNELVHEYFAKPTETVYSGFSAWRG